MIENEYIIVLSLKKTMRLGCMTMRNLKMRLQKNQKEVDEDQENIVSTVV
jgi:hypothetical protein